MLITAVGRGGGDNVLRDTGPVGGAERWGGGEGDGMGSMTPIENAAPLPKVICGDMVLLGKGGGEVVFPGGGGGGENVKDSCVGVVPK